MTRIRTIALAILAVFCLSVVAVAAASANEGELVNKNGAALTKNKVKGTAGKTTLETVGGAKITCESATAEGVVTSKTTGEGTAHFKECKNQVGSACKTSGANPKEIIVSATNHSRRVSQPSGGILILTTITGTLSILCGAVTITVRGSFLTPVGASQEKSLKTLYLVTAKQSKGVQEQLEYENEAKEKVKNTLEAKIGAEASFEQAGEEGSADGLGEEAGEFK